MRIYMALAQNRLIAPVWAKLRTKVGVRFTRFVLVAVAALATSEILLSICNGVFHMTATPAALISTFSGAAVSYVLSRWAWERKGKPDVLRETVPFWVISGMVWVILWLATKLGYHMASWLGLHGAKHVLLVDLVYLAANLVTFVLRFVIFHYVLFTDRTTAARAAATGPDVVPPATRRRARPRPRTPPLPERPPRPRAPRRQARRRPPRSRMPRSATARSGRHPRRVRPVRRPLSTNGGGARATRCRARRG
jgi:putative flippase GtrA